MLDLLNREVVGWSIKARMTADLVADVLAWFRRRPGMGKLLGRADEELFNSLENERTPSTRYRTQREAAADLFEYIEVFYNRSGRHSSLTFVIADSVPAGLAHCSAGDRLGCITPDLWKPKIGNLNYWQCLNIDKELYVISYGIQASDSGAGLGGLPV
ncbi:transposase fragment, IS3 family [Cupriavidus taiwanensis]|uniref:Transposase, IS3 family n=2 Tax=Cupriavidus TaxID=106589 RepID=A0A375GT38_9BURK|nr:transposase fragment, IS3 family [Cupriavidus taiwanensis]SOZ40617.1 transposase fragment, IS3 family [Cupriavidus neocaledonicus]SOY76703.1 transposase fragment, IS3 family [Cupriavidus taiwanensis]SOZ20436.1 transposase fragment, IS3 family [Cupriavidus taiwanensis]SPC25057.1 transposase [Cupriavidus taiwanensis]